MSSGALKKPPSSGTSPARIPSPNATNASPSRSPSRMSTPNPPPPNGLARAASRRGANGTPMSARAAAKRPAAPPSHGAGSATGTNAEEEDAKIQNAALVEELKERLQKAESSAEEFQKQLGVVQARLDEANKEQTKLEERLHEEEEKLEGMTNENRESIRQRRELESIYEAERVSIMKDKEESQAREDELHEVIQRLKDNRSQKDMRLGLDDDGRSPRPSGFPSPNPDAGQFAPSSSLQRSDSRNNSKLILQKDKVIESLRLELAEAQIKLAEMGNMGGSKITELEGKLMQTRMANARLMEENESFQVLLSERTLNGDFSAGGLRGVSDETRQTPTTSLADELEQSSPSGYFDAEHVKRLELDLNRQKEENKALSLYINKIIERLLQHQGFESVLSNTQEGPHGSGAAAETEKDLPALPPPQELNSAPKDNTQSEQTTFLQRARSVISKDGGKPKRPMSMMTQAPSAHENPETAPSIPLQRSGSTTASKRTSLPPTLRSASGNTIPNAAGIVNNMYRPPPSDQSSPSIASPTRAGFFGLNLSASVQNTQRRTSSSQITTPDGIPEDLDEDEPLSNTRAARDAAMDALTGGSPPNATESDAPSPPRSTYSGTSGEVRQLREQNVMGGRQMRPLRLVQKNPEAAAIDDARNKAANRQSWFGGVSNFFSKGPQPVDTSQPPPAFALDKDKAAQAPPLPLSTTTSTTTTLSGGDRKSNWGDSN